MLQRIKDNKGADRGSRLDHLESVWKMSGNKPDELDIDEPFDETVYLLEYFWAVKQTAGVKISYTELKNYCTMMAVQLTALESEVIMKIDAIFEGSIYG